MCTVFRGAGGELEDKNCAVWQLYQRHKQGYDTVGGILLVQACLHLCAGLQRCYRYAGQALCSPANLLFPFLPPIPRPYFFEAVVLKSPCIQGLSVSCLISNVICINMLQ